MVEIKVYPTKNHFERDVGLPRCGALTASHKACSLSASVSVSGRPRCIGHVPKELRERARALLAEQKRVR